MFQFISDQNGAFALLYFKYKRIYNGLVYYRNEYFKGFHVIIISDQHGQNNNSISYFVLLLM